MRERLAIPTGWIKPPWPKPKDEQNKTAIFLSVYGVFLPVNGAAGGVGSLVSCEIYQKINVHKTSTYSYIYRPYWCWKNTSGSRYDRDPIQQAF